MYKLIKKDNANKKRNLKNKNKNKKYRVNVSRGVLHIQIYDLAYEVGTTKDKTEAEIFSFKRKRNSFRESCDKVVKEIEEDSMFKNSSVIEKSKEFMKRIEKYNPK